MVNGFNKDKLALAGIQDSSFQDAYQAKAKEQAQQAEAESALAQLIKGKSLDLSNKNAETDHLDAVQQARRGTDLSTAQSAVDDGAAKGRKLSVKIGDVSMSQADAAPPNPLAQDRADNQKERLRQALIQKINADYQKSAGALPKQALAAQAVMNAIKSGDVTTIGRIKAQLPILEGENFKPTDAERELILQPTGEGAASKLKNWLGGDSAAASKSQIDALSKFVTHANQTNQDQLGRVRKEVISRWKPNVKALDPDSIEALGATLGMSSQEVMQHVADQQNQNPEAPKGPQGLSQVVQSMPQTAGRILGGGDMSHPDPAREARRQELLKKAQGGI